MYRATVPVQITLEPDVDAAYIYVADEPATGWRHGTTVPIPVDEIAGLVNIDLDTDGRPMAWRFCRQRSGCPTPS